MWKYVLEKIVTSEEGIRSILLGDAMFVQLTEEGVKLGTFVSSA
jgi:hypothetical protein